MHKMWFVFALLLGAPALAQPHTGPAKAVVETTVAPELVKARAAIRKKQWKAAQAALEPLVAAQPEHGVAQATLAHVLMLQGEAHYKRSLEHFMIAAKLLPNSPEVHYGRGAVMLLMGMPRETKKERRWLAGRGHRLAGWLMYVIEDKRIPDPLKGIIGVDVPPDTTAPIK